MDQARLTYRLYRAFAGRTGRLLYARYTYHRSRGALAGSPRGVLVDSSVGMFAIT